LSKEEIVKLYSKRDELSKTLGELLPIIQENNRSKMDSSVNELEHEGVKEYLNGLKEYLDDPEEMQTVVQVVKDILAIVN
jgi:hypothetical protein